VFGHLFKLFKTIFLKLAFTFFILPLGGCNLSFHIQLLITRMQRAAWLLLFVTLFSESSGQYKWKLEKDRDGIKVFVSDVAGSGFKAVKVECTLNGTYEKLISILSNVTRNDEWVYNSKTNIVVSQNTAHDFVYYTETHLPWPVNNRDVVIHLRIQTDNLPHSLTVTGRARQSVLPELPGIVRMKHYVANWKVTMPTSNTIRIEYVMEIDPGGSLPSWLANMFVDKGPYETFKNLAERLKK